MSIAYFDCFSGISGNMVLGALIDVGFSHRYLRAELKKLPLSGYRIKVAREARQDILGRKVTVEVDEREQTPRSYVYIKKLIQKSSLEVNIKTKALKIFEKLAEVEAQIHGKPITDVYFHEIGSTDSIIDIVGTAIGLATLGIRRVYASKIPLGKGFVSCQHGILPVPSPATIALLKGIPVYFTDIEHELVTPTGAAIIANICQDFGRLPSMKPLAIGYGVGKRDIPNRPNLLRIIVGKEQEEFLWEEIDVLETNIDDMNPMFHGYLMERLFELGALDVSLLPVHMKKNRPGILLKVICKKGYRNRLIELLFNESTTLGIRCYHVDRVTTKRSLKRVNTPHGYVRVKVAVSPQGKPRLLPEYEDCKRIARKSNTPLREVYEEVTEIAKKMCGE